MASIALIAWFFVDFRLFVILAFLPAGSQCKRYAMSYRDKLSKKVLFRGIPF